MSWTLMKTGRKCSSLTLTVGKGIFISVRPSVCLSVRVKQSFACSRVRALDLPDFVVKDFCCFFGRALLLPDGILPAPSPASNSQGEPVLVPYQKTSFPLSQLQLQPQVLFLEGAAAIECLTEETFHTLIFGSDRSPRSANLRASVRSKLVQSSHSSSFQLKSSSNQSAISQQSVSSQSAVSQQSVRGQSAVSQQSVSHQ